MQTRKGWKRWQTNPPSLTHTHTHTHTHTPHHRTPSLALWHPPKKNTKYSFTQYFYLINGTTNNLNNLTSESAKCKMFYLATKAALNLLFGILGLHQQLHCLLPLLSHVPQFGLPVFFYCSLLSFPHSEKKKLSGWVVKFGYLNQLNANVGKGKLIHIAHFAHFT